MSDISDTVKGIKFGEKVGPLPVWGWGVLVAGILFIVYYLYNRFAGTSTATTTTSSAIDPNGYQTAGISGGTATTDTSTTTTTPSNGTWLAQAALSVADKLGVSQSDVYATLSNWLQGNAIPAANQKYVDAALAGYGAPPEGTIGVSPITPTPVVTTTPPATTTPPKTTTPTYRTTMPDGGKLVTSNSTLIWWVHPNNTRVALSAANRKGVYAHVPVTHITSAQINKYPIVHS